MSEYIDKSEAVGEGYLQDWYISSVSEDDEPVWTEAHIEELAKDFIVIPKDTPGSDVVPVVHAHWINESPYRALNGDFRKTQECSRCHRTYVSAGNTQCSNHKFCAECGAKMDGPVEWLKL